MSWLLCNGCNVTTKMGHFHGINHLSHSYAWDKIFIPLGNIISTSALPRWYTMHSHGINDYHHDKIQLMQMNVNYIGVKDFYFLFFTLLTANHSCLG